MENFKYKLSVIIPMYNAEKYIANCLDSILNSDLPKECYEVAIINDGSKDKGPEIAQEYVSRHSNFIYLNQKNQGQSMARNYGIREAQGEYIWCVDADDKLDSVSLVSVYEELNSHLGLDILAFQLKQVTENGVFVSVECSQPQVKHNSEIKGREAIIQGYCPSSVCALIVRKQMLIENELFFKEGITQQDVELSYRLFAHAKNVYFSDIAPYIYIHHPNSTSKPTDVKKIIKYQCDKVEIIKSFRRLSLDYINTDIELADTILNFADDALFGCVYGLFQNRKKWKPLGVNQAALNKLKEEDLYPLKLPFTSWKKWMVCKLLNIRWLIA